MKKYTIINETNDFIICEGIYEDYHKAVGVIYCKFLNCIDEWVNIDGYKLIEKNEFVPLEADSGYGWFAKLIYEEEDVKIVQKERWYLLEYKEVEYNVD